MRGLGILFLALYHVRAIVTTTPSTCIYHYGSYFVINESLDHADAISGCRIFTSVTDGTTLSADLASP